MNPEACSICASLLSEDPGKGTGAECRLGCCRRTVCGVCLKKNSRFGSYCPYCQISAVPSPLPQGGLRDPPSYSPPTEAHATDDHHAADEEPPPYPAHDPLASEKKVFKEVDGDAPDVLHFVDPDNDSLTSLSLRYGVPPEAIKKTNKLFADHLLAAHRTILIPGEYYKGRVSLSPRPPEGEEGEIKRGKIRRWMVTCKVADYDVALCYLGQAHYDLDQAVQAYQADEAWERAHPLEAAKRGKAPHNTFQYRNWRSGGSEGPRARQLQFSRIQN